MKQYLLDITGEEISLQVVDRKLASASGGLQTPRAELTEWEGEVGWATYEGGVNGLHRK